jgi:alpha-beta hydrolase superfamily lysophospholipase
MIRFVLLLMLAAPLPALGAGRPVTFPSLDGITLSGEFFEAANRPSPGVVLVHMLTRNKDDWHSLPDRIRDAGMTALAIDLRGHGGSSGSAADLAGMVQDVRAAARWLASRANVRPDAIAVVGA